MPKLAAFGVPAKRWSTRSDLLSLLEQAKTYLDEAPNGASITDAARAAHLSPYHFAHRFRETFQVSPAQYHRDALVRRAKTLLVTSSASEVAFALGYQSVSAFGRAFKKAVGVTPGAWRGTQSEA
jgi:AraC family transcriptional regulator